MNREREIVAMAGSVIECAESDVQEHRRRMVTLETALLDFNSNDERLMSDLEPMLGRLNHEYERYETALESEFSGRLLEGAAEVRQYPLYRRFTTLLANEVRLLRAAPGDRLAMVGSGPFPITAIILAGEFGIKVTAVERHEHAATLSRRVIQRLGLQDRVQVECGYGQHLVSQDVSCAIIALLAKPKTAILENVFRNYARCAAVICRTSHGVRQALYCPAEPGALDAFQIMATNHARGDQTISSILLARSAAKVPSLN